MIPLPHLARFRQAPFPSLSCPPVKRRARLLNWGVSCLRRGEWQMVMAITRLIPRRGWSHV